MNKLYVYSQNPNGTSGLLICDSDYQVIDYIEEAIFGNIPAKSFGWSGDSLGNIDACYHGESVNMVSYDDELIDDIENDNVSDVQQVMEVDLDDVLDYITTSPVNDGSETIKTLRKYFRIEDVA